MYASASKQTSKQAVVSVLVVCDDVAGSVGESTIPGVGLVAITSAVTIARHVFVCK